jgi:DNA-binding NtrC family response regulator
VQTLTQTSTHRASEATHVVLLFPPRGPLVRSLPARGEVVIGREEPADLVVDDPSVSRRHARLVVDDDGVKLEDLGSKNGTSVGGAALARGERRRLQVGVEAKVGTVRLVIEASGAQRARRAWISEASFEDRLDEELTRPDARGCLVWASGARAALETLASGARAYERVAAIADDEFLALWPATPEAQAIARAEAWARALGGRAVLVPLVGGRSTRAERLERLRAATVEPLEAGQVRFVGDVVARISPRGERRATKLEGVVAASAAMQALLMRAGRLAATDLAVVLEGPTGSGKEVLAELLHELGPRADAPFVAVNCATLRAELAASELFGHEREAFTGADGGTLFLDEVAELSAEVQAALLRALETRAVRRVGGTRERPVDVRIVAASATPLLAHVEANRFRDDLYYRLQGDVLQVPALAARREDVLPLARRFVADHAEQRRRAPPRLSSEVEEALVRYDWPGNVRELRQLVARAMALVDGDVIEREHLPERLFPPRGDGGASVLASGGARPAAPVASPIGWPIVLRETLASIERQLVEAALAEARGNVRAAAKLVGLPERTFAYRMELLGVPRG